MLPLEGVRVLDLSRVLAGPYATMMLADLGADVLKIEHPERGDDTRHWGPPFAGSESAYFLSVNRNKRSAGVDLKAPAGIVYCSITGFGPGPDEDRPGYDFLVQARGGIMGITGFDEPTKVGVAIADMVCGLQAAVATLAALYRRNATGEGARIEVPLFESQLSWLANRAQEYLVSGEDVGRLGNAHPSIVPYQTFD